MPTVTTASFVNGSLKPTMDAMADLYYKCKRALNTYNALNLAPPNDTNVVAGTELTGAEVIGGVYCAQDFVTYCENNGLAKLFEIAHASNNP